jgi:mRNA interferase RelE/StbE
MAKSVLLSTPAQRQFEALDKDAQRRVRKGLERLAAGGRADVKRLKGVKGREDLFRLRVGDYWVVYSEDSDAIRVTRVFHRSAGYDWL